jgi:site-specific DNA-cytosine methylase
MTITQKEQEKTLPVLEFYSGIGGFHFALLSSSRAKERNSCVVQAFDINTNAIQVYEQNFPHAPPVNRVNTDPFIKRERPFSFFCSLSISVMNVNYYIDQM